MFAWGIGLSFLGLVAFQTQRTAPPDWDPSWDIVEAGMPVRGIVRMQQHRTWAGPIIELHGPPNYYNPILGLDADAAWLAFNVGLLTAAALVILLLPQRIAELVLTAGVALSVPAIIAGMMFLANSLPR